jgi:pectin methylesterase-like acyl-CoA thioesterase
MVWHDDRHDAASHRPILLSTRARLAASYNATRDTTTYNLKGQPMFKRTVLSFFVIFLSAFGSMAHAQDSNGPSPLSFLDTSNQTFDILVDGSLAQDNPAQNQYKTLQAAYAAAPAGTATRQTVIGIKPNVYNLNGGQMTPGLMVTKNFITFLGLTNDHRNVVLAGNLGNEEGAGGPTAQYDGYVIIVNATGFMAVNLTILNYCNVNYEYPGNPALNLTERSPVVTQAVALQLGGDKEILDHVALLSKLDTTFIQSTRAYFNSVYIEGTNDFIGGGTESVWENSVVNFPTGDGEGTVTGTVFVNTTFTVPGAGTIEFYKGPTSGGAYPEGSTLPAALINCVFPVNTGGNTVSLIKGFAPTTPQNLYTVTYQNKDVNGNPILLADASQGSITHNLSREMSAQEAAAFSPGNILSATPTGVQDNWDPAGILAAYTGQTVPGLVATNAAGQGNLPYGMGITNGTSSIISNQTTATVSATVFPARAPRTITWSTSSPLVSLNQSVGSSITVSGMNTTGVSQYVPINATSSDGFFITAWVFVQPPFISAPTFKVLPKVGAPVNGTVTLSYTLNSVPNRIDESIITWFSCPDPTCATPRTVGISNGNIPLQTYTLQAGDVGQYLKATIQPKWDISNPGTAVSATGTTPVAIPNLVSTTVSPNFLNFPPNPESAFINGYWTVQGTWTSEAPPVGSTFVNNWGFRVASQGAALLFQQDGAYGDEQVSVVMTPEKTAGQGFGSAGSGDDSAPGALIQNADIYIKYDPRTGNGYSLRWWRSIQSATAVVFQLYKHVNGVGSPIDSNQVLTGAFKPNSLITLSIIGSTFTATGSTTADATTLFLQSTITPNAFGGAGTRWSGTVPSGNSNAYSFFQISYPGTIQLVTTAQLSKVTDGYQAVVTVKNNGTGTAQDVQLNTASLGSAAGTVPAILLGNLPAGTSSSVTVTFPASAGASGAATAEKFAGSYTGGTFGGSFRATLP